MREGLLGVLLILLWMAGCSKPGEIVILHFNDTHSQFLPFESDGETVGGAASRATLIEKLRRQNPEMIVADAGGMMTGTGFCSVFKGEMSITLMNEMNYDLMTVGNHELDYGLENLLELEETADFPFLSANLLNKKNGEPVFNPYVVIESAGKRILFIGLTTSDWNVVNQHLKEEIVLTDESEALRRYLRGLNLSETNDLTVLVSHAGYETDLTLAQEFTELDVILSGNGDMITLYPQPVNQTLILQAGDKGEYAGMLTLTLDDEGLSNFNYELLLINDSLDEDETVAAEIARRQEIVDEVLSEVIAQSETALSNEEIRSVSGTLGNFVADCIVNAESADLAIVNVGGIRSGLPEGEIRLSDVYELYPYDNFLIRADIKGEYLRSAIKKGIKKRNEGGFLHYSEGVSVKLDKSGEVDVTINGKSLSDDRYYNILMADFQLLGGDGYDEFTNCINVSNTGKNIRDVMIDRIRSIGTIKEEDLDEEKRIII